MKKTYAARGLIEWVMTLTNPGGFSIKICFSGGSMGINGVIPAKYSTDNPVIQHLIEKSKEFSDNRIVLVYDHGN